MKRSIWIWQLFGFGVVSLLGTLLHFLYEWLDCAWWIAPFSGVNESTWEHMKLLFWPMLAFAFLESFFFREYRNFACIKLRGILLGLALIPVLFYTYNGVIGKSPDFINIAIFFIAAASSFLYETKKLYENELKCKNPRLASVVLSLIALCFIVFTFRTPKLDIFKDPLTNQYGIAAIDSRFSP